MPGNFPRRSAAPTPTRATLPLRRSLITAVVAALAAATAAVVTQMVPTSQAYAGSDPYSFRNAQIDGGGFVPGIIFNQPSRTSIYARTDIGGAYRWNQASQSLDAAAGLGRAGQLGLQRRGQPGHRRGATQPGVRRRRHVHQRLGPQQRRHPALRRPGRHLAGHRRCRSSSAATCPAGAWGSGWPSTPTATASLYFGAPSGNGLWRSTDFGATWAKVTSFPNAGNYVADPSDAPATSSDNQGVAVGHLRQAHRHGRHHHADHLRRRRRQGRTPSTAAPTAAPPGSAIPGQPTGYLAHKGVLDPVNRYLYIATSDTGGPYDGGKGDVWKYDHRHRRLDADQPDPVEQRRRLLRLQRTDHRPAAPRHHHGRRPRSPGGRTPSSSAAPTAARPGPGSGTSRATPTAACRYTHGHLARALADLRQPTRRRPR